ncbi:Rap family tetratricopeptide repeat protein [Cytobacillus horneckiae]|uniref:response regulator aspartate phosphatase n=1 Tax=Cytobacillus horneckiae TaxID=549687 RepID=UPI0039A3DF15
MNSKIPAVIVGSKCVDWYSCIIQSDFKKATELKHELEGMIQDMEQDDKVISYYNLLLFRYNLLMQNPQSDEHIRGLEHSKIDPYLKYMYYFLIGQRKFYEYRYTSAIKFYGLAENLLDQVSDQYERAEFYLRLADGYYRINQFTFAVSYMEQAIQLFKQNDSYRNKVLNGYLLLAAIESELGNYENAEARYNEILVEASAFPKVHSLTLRSLGLNRVRQNKQSEAKVFFERALKTGDHEKTVAGYKSKADLAFIHLRLGNSTAAMPLLMEVEEWLHSNGNIEYKAKCLIYRHLYVDYNEKGIKQGLDQLTNYDLFFDASEIAEELSRYYEEKEQLGQALYYANLALQMNTKQNQLGSVDIEKSR